MSRVGKLPIKVPSGVAVAQENDMITVTGPKGTLSCRLPQQLELEIEPEVVRIKRQDDASPTRGLHGLMRSLVYNMVHGVSQGFTVVLEIQGTGYRAEVQNNVLNLSLGYSHPVQFQVPESIKASVERQTVIRLDGIHKELLGQTAARIRALRPAEPYKGKGIRFAGEHIHRKVGKAGSKK
ncbi:MAG TPA: 50S ribosomal protein L6 [Syntrophobacteraceae bacterium]|nr:50S ribosomal protein L6 [Syntrophobacteraceae bacterium]